MSKHSSAFKAAGTLVRLGRDRRGATLVEFGLVLPALMGVTLGILEFTLLGFDYVRAGEATRRAARIVTMSTPPVDISALDAPVSPITCVGVGGGGVTCNGTPAADASMFDNILAEMRTMLPRIALENLQVVYKHSGIGDITTPGGIKPLVTVNLVGMNYSFALLGVVPGVSDTIPFPTFSTTLVGNSFVP
jgi:hypothetical protein